MRKSFWRLMASGRSKEKYLTLQEASEAAKDYLRNSSEKENVFILKFEDRHGPIRGRMYFKASDGYFPYKDTKWSR